MARRSQRLRRKLRIERAKTREQEDKLSKTIEENSVMLEKMKSMSSTIEEVLHTFDASPEVITEIKSEQSPMSSTVVELKAEPSVEMKFQPFVESVEKVSKTPNFKKMLKKDLLSYAKENGITTRPSMTKTQIIKAIESK